MGGDRALRDDHRRSDPSEEVSFSIEQAPDAVVVTTAGGSITAFNAAAERAFGYWRDEVLGRPMETLIPERFREQHVRHRAGYLQAPTDRPMGRAFALRGLRKDGTEFPADIVVSPVQTSQGLRVFAFVRDMTEHLRPEGKVSRSDERAHQAQNAALADLEARVRERTASLSQANLELREAEARYRTLVENAPEAIVVLDAGTGRFMDVNENAVRLFGLPRETLLQLGPVDLSPTTQPDGRPSAAAAQEKIQEALAGGVPVFEWNHRDGQGREIPCEIRLVMLPATGRKLVRGSVTDITSRKRAEAQLQASEERFRTIYEQSLFGMVIWAPDGRTLSINRAWQEMWHVDDASARHLLGTYNPLHDPQVAAMGIRPLFERAFAGEALRFPDLYYDPAVSGNPGRPRWFSISVYPVHSREGHVREIIGIYDDITNRKDMEQELARHRTQLEDLVSARTRELHAANRELESFSHAVAHDLRTPLRGIAYSREELSRGLSHQPDKEAQTHLARIERDVRHMSELIDALIELSRATRGDLERRPVAIAELAREIITDLQARQPERNVEFVVQAEDVVEADPPLLKVALENLLANAWKYTSTTPHAKVEFGVANDENGRAFFVRDNGIGFDDPQAERLFRVFSRLPSARAFEGTGLGLATVRRIVERHGGRVWAHGETGKGATFYFTLGA